MAKILIVEDDVTLAYGIEIVLKSHGYETLIANTIQTAKQFINNNNYHLAILDVMLDDGSGYDLLGLIREKSNIPVIFLSALQDELNIVTGLNLGADDYMVKPFKVGELVSRIQANLRRVKTDGNNEYTPGTLRLVKDQTKVYKNNTQLNLTITEYKLLNYFMENSCIILTKQKLLEHIWDKDSNFVDENTLAVNIKRLRDKIEDSTNEPVYIKTVRGMGYVWEKRCTIC